MYAIPGQRHRVELHQHAVEGRLRIDEHGIMSGCDLAHHGAVAIHERAHWVGAVRLDEVGRHQHQTLEPRAGCSDQLRQRLAIRVDRHMNLGLQRRVELTPDIVDPDHDREPVGLLLQHVGLPARVEIAHGIAVEAHIDDPHALLGNRGMQQAIHQADIAFAKRPEESFADRPGALAIGD